MKITGIKKAVGDYKRANAGGIFSPIYGCLMLDRSTGEVWTDEFYSLGHNEWKEYHDKSIINLVHWATYNYPEPCCEDMVSVINVKKWAEYACAKYKEV